MQIYQILSELFFLSSELFILKWPIKITYLIPVTHGPRDHLLNLDQQLANCHTTGINLNTSMQPLFEKRRF
jgi:hypothetical protein